MYKLLIIAMLMASCYAFGKQTNSEWKINDQVLKVYDIMYNNLALTVEDASNCQIRAYTIVITTVFRLMASDGDTSVKADVSQPADVIASNFRSTISVERTMFAPVISMIKRACPPTASETECQKALATETEKETKKCSGFPRLLEMYNQTKAVCNDEEFKKLMCEIVSFSKKCVDDKLAMKYVEDIIKGQKYKESISKLVDWYEAYSSGDFPCNLPPVKCNTIEKPDKEDKPGGSNHKHKPHSSHHEKKKHGKKSSYSS